MKRNSILVSFLIFTISAKAQPATSGYYITLTNDTVHTMLKIPETLFNEVGTNRLYKKIKVLDSGGNSIKLKPASIKGFGFTKKDKEYAFVSKPVKNKMRRFFQILSAGSNATLFYYSFYTNAGKARTKREMFIIEKPVENDLLIKDHSAKRKIKNSLTQFFSDSPSSLQLIDSSRISAWHLKSNLKTFVDDINKL